MGFICGDVALQCGDNLVDNVPSLEVDGLGEMRAQPRGCSIQPSMVSVGCEYTGEIPVSRAQLGTSASHRQTAYLACESPRHARSEIAHVDPAKLSKPPTFELNLEGSENLFKDDIGLGWVSC